MKKLLTLFVICSTIQVSCQEKKSPATESGEKAVNEMKSTATENAGAAKMPKGKIKYSIDGTLVELPDNQNQCMIIGMGKDYGQLLVSGGNKLTVIYVGKPKLGPIEIRKTAGIPDLGLQIIDNGIEYSNRQSNDLKFEITKMTPDGNNTYIAGTFSGTLKSADGQKTIVVSNGSFESAYVK
jgi:hypothetical protein